MEYLLKMKVFDFRIWSWDLPDFFYFISDVFWKNQIPNQFSETWMLTFWYLQMKNGLIYEITIV